MDAAFDNLNRIRLIWGRLWAALAAHLVAAACHADPGVSVLAVGHMRALVQRLLARSELSCFTHQASPLCLGDAPMLLSEASGTCALVQCLSPCSELPCFHMTVAGSAWQGCFIKLLCTAPSLQQFPSVAIHPEDV